MDKAPMAVIIAAMKDKKKADMSPIEGQDEMENEVESEDGLSVAAEEILAAIKAEDSAALSLALKSFYEMCC